MKATFTHPKTKQPILVEEVSPYELPDPFTDGWINKVKIQWCISGRRSPGVTQVLSDFFSSSKNPYEAALRGMACAGDFYLSRPTSMAFYIMEYFAFWKKLYTSKLPELTPDLKVEAFQVVTKQKNVTLIEIVIDAYEMKSDKFLFVNAIKELVQKNLFKEACQGALFLELYDSFTVDEFIIPLIFQDKFAIAQEFLNKNPKVQLEAAQYLDKILGEKNVKAEVQRIIWTLKIKETKIDKMSSKSLSKLLKRIITIYKISPDLCPNLTKKKGSGALQFLLRKRFVEKGIGKESWDEMAEEAVGDDHDLRMELIGGLIGFGKYDEAFAWAEKYNIPEDQRPFRIHYGRKKLQDPLSKFKPLQKKEQKTGESSEDFHKLTLPESQIHLVDTVPELINFLENSLKGVYICGIDCEWKPTMGLRKSMLALMQIATLDAVYIIDIWKLLPITSSEIWQQFGEKILMNPELLKVGFSFDSDLSIIHDTIPSLKTPKLNGNGFVDLLSLWRILANNYNFEFPFAAQGSSGNSESLNRLVELTLGEKLDKSDQFSNWEKRPLRKSQLTYAALDAYCLIEVFCAIERKATSENLPFPDILYHVTEGKSAANRKKNKNKTP